MSDLPAGAYVVTATLTLEGVGGGASCGITNSDGSLYTSYESPTGTTPFMPVSLTHATEVEANGSVSLACLTGQPNVKAQDLELVAVRLGSLTEQSQ